MNSSDNRPTVSPMEKVPAGKPRITTRGLLVFYDFLIYLIAAALLLAVYRDGNPFRWQFFLLHTLVVMVSVFVMRFAWQIYRQVWRYGGIQSYIRLLLSDACAFFIALAVELALGSIRISIVRLLCLCCVTLLGSLSIRMLYRYAYKCCSSNASYGKALSFLLKVFAGNRVELNTKEPGNKIRVAIVGAGRVGVSLAEELLGSHSSAYAPCCFIDINREKIGRKIFDIPIFSESEVNQELFDHYRVQEAVIALPQLTAEEKKNLYERYKSMGCKVKVYDYPIIQQAGEGGKRHLREFDVEELLFRKPIAVTDEKTSLFYRDKVVMITGGGGSIGSELCRQVAKNAPARLVILDVYENGAYDVQQELRIAYGASLDVRVEILSVCNRAALEKIFATYHPAIVIHAAAHKHVPLMEHNCCEAVENNVFGTLNVVELCEKYGVRRMMMVSTDKAVNPTNVMGATKRMCEMIVQSHSATSATSTFSATRFGNVLGSAGSVIPLFKRQIAAGGPLTVTDKRIIRYFMTIPEASQLVLQSGAMAKNGELFVLDMSKPVRILDLAENMVRLSGFEPYRDIDIVETGLRPGEKLYEELLIKTEELEKTENHLIFIERDEPIAPEALAEKLAVLRRAVETQNDDTVRAALHEVVPTFRRPEEVNAGAETSQEMRTCGTGK